MTYTNVYEATTQNHYAWQTAVRKDSSLCSSVVTVYSLSGVQATYEYLIAYMERNNEQA